MKPVIAYVDDEVQNLTFYREILSEAFEVETYSRSLDLTAVLEEKSFDCFILDIYMPVLDGFQLFERIREKPENSKTPIFFITTNPHDEVKISSYKKGATDFFDRMVKKDELVARLESKIKVHKENLNFLKIGNLSINLHDIDCYLNGKKIVLTLLEFKVLSKLIQAYPNKVSKDDLVRAIWGDDKVNQNNLNTHLYNLRMKIEDWNHEIDNHRFLGFSIKTKENK